MSRLGSGSLLSCIDDALRSLDEAIIAEEDCAFAPAAQLVNVVGDDHRNRALPSDAAAVHWLCAALRSCAHARQGAAFHQWALTATHDSQCCVRTAVRHRCFARIATIPKKSQEQLAACASRACERRILVRLFHEWQHSTLHSRLMVQLDSKDQHRVSWLQSSLGTGGRGVRRAVATIEQRQSLPGQLAAVEAESRWLRRAAHVERLVDRILVWTAIRSQQAQTDAFFALRRYAIQDGRLAIAQGAGASPRRLLAVECTTQTRIICVRWLGFILTRSAGRYCDWAFRQLAMHDDVILGRNFVAKSRHSAQARTALQNAWLGLTDHGFRGEDQPPSRGRRDSCVAESWLACTGIEASRPRTSPLDVFAPTSADAWL